MYQRPYLDSSVYIAAVKGEVVTCPDGTIERRGELASNILKDAARGRYPVVASTLIRVEVYKDRGDDKRPSTALTESEEASALQFFDHGFIEWVELSLPLADRARDLARANELRPADAVHLASALAGGADVLLRWDNRWPGGPCEELEVSDPYWEGQPEIEGFAG